MSASHFTSRGNIVMHLRATYPRRRRAPEPKRNNVLVDIRLTVSTFQEESHVNASTPSRIVEDRLVGPASEGVLEDRVHAMLASAVRGSQGVGPDDVMFLSCKIAVFAFSSALSGLTEQGAYSCTLEVYVDVHEWLTGGLAELLQGSPSESELGGGRFGGVPASDEAIESVHATTYRTTAEEDGQGAVKVRETTCAVCFEDFMAGQELRVMPCGHAFHKGCLDPWLRSSHVCPLCRFPIATSQEST